MKHCPTCNEEFADRFAFCPVDGTPMEGFAAVASDTMRLSATETEQLLASAYESFIEGSTTDNGNSPHDNATYSFAADEPEVAAPDSLHSEYHLTIIEDTGLTRRLLGEISGVARESRLTWPEFKKSPFGFTRRLFVGYGQALSRFLLRPNVAVSLLIAFSSMALLTVGMILLERVHSPTVSRVALSTFALAAIALLVGVFFSWFRADDAGVAQGRSSGSSANAAIALVASVFLIVAVGGGIFFLNNWARTRLAADPTREDLEVTEVVDIPDEQDKNDPGAAGTNKGKGGGSKPKQEKPGGGGGGGDRNETKPTSHGKIAAGSLQDQIVVPKIDPPPTKPPLLPTLATIKADPMLVPLDTRDLPFGDPKSKSTDPSRGRGEGEGMGAGTGTGQGSGDGAGLGPGRGYNTGGGDTNLGGGGPGGGGGGGDYDRIFNQKEVTQKARILAKPEPQYTEDARKNQINGTVVLRAVFSSGGQVTSIKTVSGLGYGLTEKAIQAARLIKFIPAMKDGRPVSVYIELHYNFNLY